MVSFGFICLCIVILYRLLYLKDYLIIVGVFFFYEFVEYFEFVVMFSDKLLIIGDFNIFMDVFIDCNNIYYRDFLEVMGFV